MPRAQRLAVEPQCDAPPADGKRLRAAGENDTEVAACYISSRLAEGARTLGAALEGTLEDLDEFFTFVVGTKNGFGVVRDPIACKPAVMAETEVTWRFGSEYRATKLPGDQAARLGTRTRHRLFLGALRMQTIRYGHHAAARPEPRASGAVPGTNQSR